MLNFATNAAEIKFVLINAISELRGTQLTSVLMGLSVSFAIFLKYCSFSAVAEMLISFLAALNATAIDFLAVSSTCEIGELFETVTVEQEACHATSIRTISI